MTRWRTLLLELFPGVTISSSIEPYKYKHLYNKIISAGLYMDIIDFDESSYRGIYRRASFSIQKFLFHTYKYTSFPYLHIQTHIG